MRDPNRIPGVLQEVQKLWEKHPDLRLGQLLLCTLKQNEDLFNCEDDVLMQRIREFDALIQAANKKS
jgi:uncharacterized protein YihD (DUF1040 family)